MHPLIELGLLIFGNLYAYCTDFIINLANLFEISYYETNFILFIILFPLALVGSAAYFFIQSMRLHFLKRRKLK